MKSASRLFSGARGSPYARSLIIALTFVGYRQVRYLTRNDTDAAFDNAAQVVDVERTLHVFAERRLQELSMGLDGVIGFLNHYYVFVHFPVSFGFVAWVVIRHRDLYPRFRNWFLSVTLAALVIHVAYPAGATPHARAPGLRRHAPGLRPEHLHQGHQPVGRQPVRGDALAALRLGAADRPDVREDQGRTLELAGVGASADHVAGDRRHRQPLHRRRRRRAGAGGRLRHGARAGRAPVEPSCRAEGACNPPCRSPSLER